MRRFALVLLACSGVAFGADSLPARLVPLSAQDRAHDLYPWAVAMWSGPWRPIDGATAEDDPMEVPREERWRLVYFEGSDGSPPTLELEHLVRGAEGCCSRLEGRFLLDIGRPVSRIAFRQWTGFGSFTFAVDGVVHEIQGLGMGEIRVRVAGAG